MVRGFNFNFQLFCCVLYVFGNWFLPCLSTNPNEGRQCNLRSEICMLSIARGLRKSCSLFKKLSKSYLVRYLKWRWFYDHFIDTRYYWFAFFFFHIRPSTYVTIICDVFFKSWDDLVTLFSQIQTKLIATRSRRSTARIGGFCSISASHLTFLGCWR